MSSCFPDTEAHRRAPVAVIVVRRVGTTRSRPGGGRLVGVIDLTETERVGQREAAGAS